MLLVLWQNRNGAALAEVRKMVPNSGPTVEQDYCAICTAASSQIGPVLGFKY